MECFQITAPHKIRLNIEFMPNASKESGCERLVQPALLKAGTFTRF